MELAVVDVFLSTGSAALTRLGNSISVVQDPCHFIIRASELAASNLHEQIWRNFTSLVPS